MIRIVIAEDQDMILGALAALLSLEHDFEIIGQAKDGDAALQMLLNLKPDILISDIEMPGKTGLDLAAEIKERSLGIGVLIVTTFGRSGYMRRAMDLGVRGYLLKDAPSSKLADAVRKIKMGGKVISPELMDTIWGAPNPLTERESHTLKLAEDGKSSKEIARTLNIAPGTVRNYLSTATQKLEASNRIEAARIARANGWL